MNNEIKEILDKFDKVLGNYELDKKWGQMSVDSICHLFPSEMMVIKDCITNLQEELEEQKRIEQADFKTIQNLEEENKDLKYSNIYLSETCDKYKTLVDRHNKAIEYINKYLEREYFDDDILETNTIYNRDLFKVKNILNGSDNK